MELSLSPRMEVRLSLTHEIHLVLGRTVITPEACCPKCQYTLSDSEIQQGWRDDPRDFTTECPNCGKRFVAKIKLTEEEKNVGGYNYLCRMQLFEELKHARRGKAQRLGEAYLFESYAELFWNMIRHFGTYRLALQAFKESLSE